MMCGEYSIDFEEDEFEFICNLIIELYDNWDKAEPCPSYIRTAYAKVKKVCDQVEFPKKDKR